MSHTTTTSIRLSLDKFMKVKSEGINLSQLVESFLEDYFIDTEEDFEILELKKQERAIEEQITLLRSEQLKIISKIKRKESSLEEKKEQEESLELYSVGSDEEFDFWIQTVKLVEARPELKMGRHQFYKNLYGRLNVIDWEAKFKWFKDEEYPKYIKRLQDEEEKRISIK